MALSIACSHLEVLVPEALLPQLQVRGKVEMGER